MGLCIGNLDLKNPFLLAPMLEPNDIAFRLLCKRAGAALTYTGMISPLSRKKIYFDDFPAVQLFGNSPKGFLEFIKKHDEKVALWDFNLGCPSKLSKKLSHGAFMHEDFENIENILKTMRKSTKKPVTLKLRKSPQALEIVRIANKYCDAIGIHPRTSSQGYGGKPDYKFALKIKEISNIEVIYSGDVSLSNYKRILRDFRIVFVGRAAIGNPAIFSEFLGKKIKISFFDYLILAEKYSLPFRQIKYSAMCFSKGRKNAKEIRREIILAKTIAEIKEIFKSKQINRADFV